MVVEQERDKGVKVFQEAMVRETEKCEELLKEQHGRLTSALEEERVRGEEKSTQALERAHQDHKVRHVGGRGGQGGCACVGGHVHVHVWVCMCGWVCVGGHVWECRCGMVGC